MDKCRSLSLIGKFIVSLICGEYSLQLLVLFCGVSCLPVSFRDHVSFRFLCFSLYYYSLLVITFVHVHIVERKYQALSFFLSPVSYDALSITRLCGVCETNMMYWSFDRSEN